MGTAAAETGSRSGCSDRHLEGAEGAQELDLLGSGGVVFYSDDLLQRGVITLLESGVERVYRLIDVASVAGRAVVLQGDRERLLNTAGVGGRNRNALLIGAVDDGRKREIAGFALRPKPLPWRRGTLGWSSC